MQGIRNEMALVALAAALGLGGPAQAAPIPALDINANVVTGTGSNNQSQTQGWEFRPSVEITISALGILDMGNDGLVDPHEVGVWTAGGSLLASVVVPEGTGTQKVDDFRYVDITPLVLAAGNNYVIGALYLASSIIGPSDPDPDRDLFQSIGSGGGAPRMFAPEIEFINPRISTQQVGNLTFPTVMSLAGFPAIVGPGFLFEASVPEPTLLSLLAVSLAGLSWGLGSRRRRVSLPRLDDGDGAPLADR